MQDFCDNYIKTYEGLNKWIKFILCFVYAVPENLYRLAKSLKKNDVLGTIVAVILLLSCGFFLLLVIDLVTIILYDKIYWIDDFTANSSK